MAGTPKAVRTKTRHLPSSKVFVRRAAAIARTGVRTVMTHPPDPDSRPLDRCRSPARSDRGHDPDRRTRLPLARGRLFVSWEPQLLLHFWADGHVLVDTR